MQMPRKGDAFWISSSTGSEAMLGNGESWLASWTCNFCGRRFKSAQALGGHMNVHRRARAMLISPISSPPSSSPWLPSSITTSTGQAHHPIPNYRPSNIPHHINPNQSSPSYLHISCSSILTSMHKNPLLAPAFKHMPKDGQCHHAELNNLNGLCSRRRMIHQDDVVSRLNLGTGPSMEEDIDLELRL